MANETAVDPATTRLVVFGRVSYPHVFEKWAGKPNQKEKYQLALLIPKSDKAQIEKINAAIEAAKILGKSNPLDKGGWGGKVPSKLEISFKDGDDKSGTNDEETYAGHYHLSIKTDRKPEVVKRVAGKNTPITQDEFYAGCWAYVSMNFYPYNDPKNGIAAGLGNILKAKDDEAFGVGSTTADQDFANIAVSEDEEDDFLK